MVKDFPGKSRLKKPFMGYSTPEKKICLKRAQRQRKNYKKREGKIKEMKEKGSRGR